MLYSHIFLFLVFLGGKLSSRLALPSLCGEVLVGSLLGPPLANLVPQPAAIALVGQLGLVLLVVEAGLEVNWGTLRQVGASTVGGRALRSD